MACPYLRHEENRRAASEDPVLLSGRNLIPFQNMGATCARKMQLRNR